MKKMNYIVSLRKKGRVWYLLWADGGSGPDSYLMFPKSSIPLVARSRAALGRLAEQQNLKVSPQIPHVVDIDVMEKALAALRPAKAISQRLSRILLESWNALEDISKSFGVALAPHGLTKKAATKLYEKLFYGNNLPSVTPSGKTYRPVLSEVERSALRKILRQGWTDILARM